MAIKESLLRAIQVINLNDFVRAVTSAGESRNVSVAHLAKTVIEDFQLESLGGANQSVMQAIDSMNAELATKADASDLEIDSEVLDLYESIGWIPPSVISDNTYTD